MVAHCKAGVAERRCIVTGAVRAKAELIRFVVAPDKTIVPDLAGTLPGRGMWVTARRQLVERAGARNLFAKAARSSVRVPPQLSEQVDTSLRRRCLDLIGLANRAGEAVAGYEKVRAWVDNGMARLLLQAADSAHRGRERVRGQSDQAHSRLDVIGPFTAAELGSVFGRNACVHVAVASGGIAERLITEVQRLHAFGADWEQRRISAQR